MYNDLNLFKTFFFVVFDVLCIQNLQGQICIFYRANHLGSKALSFLKKNIKLPAFFNLADKSFQRIAPIVLTVSKPNLLVLMFRLLTLTPDRRFQELFSLKLNTALIVGGEGSIFTQYISVIYILNANILYFYNEQKVIYQDSIVH